MRQFAFIATVLVLLAMFLLTSGCIQEDDAEWAVTTDTTGSPSGNDQPDRVVRARGWVESAFPEFKDFEKQESFAGRSVKSEADDGDYYLAYIVLGSGLPIAEATCFRADRAGRVFMIGVFPDPVDSYAGYRDVDPRNCRGIK
jgi:hypothetical protein